MELYLDCPEVHVFVVEVSTLRQFGKMAFGEAKSETYSLVSHHPLLKAQKCVREVSNSGKQEREQCACMGVCVYSLFNIFDLHAGRAAAAGAHEGLCP